jgi:hypothetical protein
MHTLQSTFVHKYQILEVFTYNQKVSLIAMFLNFNNNWMLWSTG